MNSILLIDDSPEVVQELASRLGQLLPAEEAEIRTWIPTSDDADPFAAFKGKVNRDTVLVVTDYDLTGKGRTGLFGSSVVAWCQTRAIPVGDYSREMKTELPKEPNLFELRVPRDTERAAPFIAAVFRGFAWIRRQLVTQSDLMTKRSPPAVMAQLLEEPSLESQFALYGVRLGATNAALVDRILATESDDVEPSAEERQALLAYIVGHLLLNSILRFPGPVVTAESLAAYVGTDSSEVGVLREVFAPATYHGPFSELEAYFWLDKVDDILRPMLDEANSLEAEGPETHGELYRTALERRLQRPLSRHSCSRCQGQNGGFWCPFRKRAVCLRSDCSVGANSWVPQGARICRIERDFYDEWAPIFGI